MLTTTRCENVQSFEHLVADQVQKKTDVRTSFLREQWSYDELDNVVERRIVGDEKVIREAFVRDAAGRLIRQIQPMGNVTEYEYDERDLLIEKRSGMGAPEGFTEMFTYTLDGSPQSRTDGDGNKTVHRYDGFERYQSLDETGNVVAVIVSDAKRTLKGARYRVDELNRVFRIDRAWQDLETGQIIRQ
jgi:YD repeat-containing protein